MLHCDDIFYAHVAPVLGWGVRDVRGGRFRHDPNLSFCSDHTLTIENQRTMPAPLLTELPYRPDSAALFETIADLRNAAGETLAEARLIL